MEINPQYIAALLKELRHTLHLKQWQVAQALKIDRSTYAYYETGKTIPNLKMLMGLSKIFHVSMDYFLSPDSASRNLVLQDINMLSPKERKLVFDFFQLNENNKAAVMAFIEKRLRFQETIQSKNEGSQ